MSLSASLEHSALRIAAIDTSARVGSVAVARGSTLLAEESLPSTSRHAIEMLPTLQSLLQAQGWMPGDLDHLYLATGPGSFTGLRIAIAAARALAQARGAGKPLRLLGLSSLEVIACNAPAEARHIVVVLDAKRSQVFAGRYVREADGSLRTAEAPALVEPRAFVQNAQAQAAGEPVYLLGEGIPYHRAALDVPNTRETPAELWPGRASVVHALGYRRFLARGEEAFTPLNELLPTYIRLPEAEEVYRKKHQLPL